MAAPQMGNMANASGRFVVRDPRRLTRIVSTPEQRLIAAMRRNRAEEARMAAAAVNYAPPAPENAAPIPVCDLRPPPINSTPWTDLSAAMG
jgi:hypothetical protein